MRACGAEELRRLAERTSALDYPVLCIHRTAHNRQCPDFHAPVEIAADDEVPFPLSFPDTLPRGPPTPAGGFLLNWIAVES